MTYLDYLNKINYTFGNFSTRVVDVFRRVSFTKETMQNPQNYTWYNTNGLEKPDVTAFINYDDPNLYHIPLLFNEIFDHTFLPKSPDQAVQDDYDFANSRSMFFPTLFPVTPRYGDLLIKINPDTLELDESSYAYVDEYDSYLRYVKTRIYENIEIEGQNRIYYQLYRQNESGNWFSVSDSNELLLLTIYGQTPYAFYDGNGAEVTPYTQSVEDVVLITYGPDPISGGRGTNLEKILVALNGNYPGQNDRRLGVYIPYSAQGFCGAADDNATLIGYLLSIDNVNQQIFVELANSDVEIPINLAIAFGYGFDLCFPPPNCRSQSFEEVDAGSIENPLDENLNPNTILSRFMTNSLSNYGYRTIQSKYSQDILQKTFIKIPPENLADQIQGEIKRLLTTGKSYEFSTITGLQSIGSESGETINGN